LALDKERCCAPHDARSTCRILLGAAAPIAVAWQRFLEGRSVEKYSRFAFLSVLLTRVVLFGGQVGGCCSDSPSSSVASAFLKGKINYAFFA
jgi:hypothetical protein